MALTLTHLRFARDILDLSRAGDRGAYYAGAVYPDSRMLTGLPRERTHGRGNPVDPFAPGLTDFEKGWAAHEFYDHLSHIWYTRLSPWPENAADRQKKWWKYITAIKTVEDMQSYEAVGGEDFFGAMPVPRPPRGEDPALLELFFRLNFDFYARPPNADSYDRLRADCRMSDEIISGIKAFVLEILAEPETVTRIARIYPAVLKETREGRGAPPSVVK